MLSSKLIETAAKLQIQERVHTYIVRYTKADAACGKIGGQRRNTMIRSRDKAERHLTRGLGGEGGLIRQVEKESTNGL